MVRARSEAPSSDGSSSAPRAMSPAWGVALGALFVSTSSVWISLSATSPGTASTFRCVLTLPFLAVLVVRERRGEGALMRPHRTRAVLAGALFSADMLLWTQAIAEVGAGLSTVLVNLQVVLVPALSWLVHREPVTRRYLLAIPAVLLGVIFTSGALDGGDAGTEPVRGAVHALLAALCYSGFLFLLRRGGHNGQIIQSYAAVTASAAVFSAAAGLVWHGLDPSPGWTAVGWLDLAAVCGQVVGWLLVAVHSPRLPSHAGATLLLLTPAGALGLGALVLDERPTPLQLLGCALILGSVVAVTNERAFRSARGKRQRRRARQKCT